MKNLNKIVAMCLVVLHSGKTWGVFNSPHANGYGTLVSTVEEKDHLACAITRSDFYAVKKYLESKEETLVKQDHLTLAQKIVVKRTDDTKKFFNPSRCKHLAIAAIAVGLPCLNAQFQMQLMPGCDNAGRILTDTTLNLASVFYGTKHLFQAALNFEVHEELQAATLIQETLSKRVKILEIL